MTGILVVKVVTVISWRPAVETCRMLGTTALLAFRVICGLDICIF